MCRHYVQNILIQASHHTVSCTAHHRRHVTLAIQTRLVPGLFYILIYGNKDVVIDPLVYTIVLFSKLLISHAGRYISGSMDTSNQQDMKQVRHIYPKH